LKKETGLFSPAAENPVTDENDVEPKNKLGPSRGSRLDKRDNRLAPGDAPMIKRAAASCAADMIAPSGMQRM
jgi:hypothetical protein